MEKKISLEEKVCNNCEHMVWLVGIGQGVRCGHLQRREHGGMAPLIPSRRYSCEKFEYKKELRKKYK